MKFSVGSSYKFCKIFFGMDMLKTFFKDTNYRLSLKGLYFEMSKATKGYIKKVSPSTTVIALEKLVHVWTPCMYLVAICNNFCQDLIISTPAKLPLHCLLKKNIHKNSCIKQVKSIFCLNKAENKLLNRLLY